MLKGKKVLSSLMVATLLYSSNVMASSFYDVSDTSIYSDAVKELYGFGIMQGSNGQFRPDALITRAEVTKVLEVTLGYGKFINGKIKNDFADVKANKWYVGVVNFANGIGFVKGFEKNGKKYFAPEDNVTFGQFATMALRGLGYKDSDLEGKWPYNYIAKADSIGLFKNVQQVNPTAYAKRSDIAIMTSNLLDISPKSEVLKSSTMTLFDTVKDKLNVDIVEGVLTTSQLDSTIPANHVKIGDKQYEVSMDNMQELLNNVGKNVKVYLNENKVKVLSKVTGNSITVTASKDSEGGYIYYNDNGEEKALSINLNAKIFINGKQSNSVLNLKKDANVTLVENNGDLSYDYIIALQSQQTTSVVPQTPTVIVPAQINIIASRDVYSNNICYMDGYQEKICKVSPLAQVIINNKPSDITKIKAGASISLTNNDNNDEYDCVVVTQTEQVTPVVSPTIKVTTTRDAVANTIFYNDNGQEKTCKVSQNASIFINGVQTTDITKIKAGANVTLINNDNDDMYDNVMATQTVEIIPTTLKVTTTRDVVANTIFYNENGQEKTCKVSPNATIFINGVQNIDITKIKAGAMVTLISNDNDDMYDNVMATQTVVTIPVKLNVTATKDAVANTIFYNENGQEKTCKVSQNATIFINGIRVTDITKIKTGANITLISNDNDDMYDNVMATQTVVTIPVKLNVTATKDAIANTIFYNENGQEKTCKVSQNASIFINGVQVTDITKIKAGANIVLINSDNDDAYDNLIVTQTVAPVTPVSTQLKVVTSKDATANTIYYKDSNGQEKTCKVASNAQITINGVVVTDITKIKAGATVVLVNNGTDDVYDILTVTQTEVVTPKIPLVVKLNDTTLRITFKVIVPATTGTDDVYIVGDFNNWVTSDNACKLTKNADGTYSITKDMQIGKGYKFTRGDWDKVEKKSNGGEVDNRIVTDGDTGNIIIEKWADK